MKNTVFRNLTLALLTLAVNWTTLPFAMGANESWTPTASMTSARGFHTATLLADGKVLVAGGEYERLLSSAELYDPPTGMWTATGSMSAGRSEHTATLLANGKVLVAGGYGSGFPSSAELYDPATGTWTATGLMTTGRYFHTAVLLANGKVLVAGGFNQYNGSSHKLSSTEIYDPGTGLWTATGSMSVARLYHTVTLLTNGKVLVAGGHNGSDLYSAELYDPATGTWTETGRLGTTRYEHTATLLANGKVLVAGGNGMDLRSSAELYDPALGTWTATGSMSTARSVHTATLLVSGKVLVAGGRNDNAELYDATTETWAAAGSMSTGRSEHTATLLANGRVLVAGSAINIFGQVYTLASAEVYKDTFTITLGEIAHGVITGAGDYTPGSTATLTATAAPGYAFTAWTGDASGTANPLGVLMDTNKTIGASFTPDTNDDDGDGLTNYQEIIEYGTNPTLPDTDGDGANDKKDTFPLDPAESLDTDHDGIGDNADPDDDNDGLSDADEISIHHTNPKRADSDGDGLTDPAELETHHTNPNLADTDNDGLSDGAEFTTHHTNPLVPDTDGDGFLDGYEVLTGKLPLDPLDKPALVAEARTAIEFTFNAALGKTYRIEDSPDLAIWATVEAGIVGTGGQIQRFYSTRGVSKRYFRVEEDSP